MLILKRLFEAIPEETVTAFVTSAPNGTSTRRAWFLYEFLTGKALDLPDAVGPSFTDLPHEIDFLRRNDEAKRRIMNLVEMPDRMTENLIRLIRVNEGKLGRKRRGGEFEKLTDDEVVSIEAIVREAFEDFED